MSIETAGKSPERPLYVQGCDSGKIGQVAPAVVVERDQEQEGARDKPKISQYFAFLSIQTASNQLERAQKGDWMFRDVIQV